MHPPPPGLLSTGRVGFTRLEASSWTGLYEITGPASPYQLVRREPLAEDRLPNFALRPR